MLQDTNNSLLLVVTPAGIEADDTMSIDLSTLGYAASVIRGMFPRIVAKEDADGVGLVIDEKVTMSGATLTITEGASDFTATERYYLDLGIGLGVVPVTMVEETP